MSSRKPGYLIGVILLTVVLSFPHLVFMSESALGIRSLPFRSRLLGIGSPVFLGGSVWSSAFWRDQFVFISDISGAANGSFEWVVSTIDIETGKITELDTRVRVPNFVQPTALGDHLWFAAFNGSGPVPQGKSFEMIDGVLQPAEFVVLSSVIGEEQRFLLDGTPAYIVNLATKGFQVSTLTDGVWGDNRDVVLPTHFGNEPIDFKNTVHLSCLNQGDRIHVFLHYGLRLFYHEGLDLQPENGAEAPLHPGIGDGATAGWSLVRAQPSPIPTIYKSHQNLFGLLVDGQPMALIVDDTGDHQPVGHLYRFDGTNWSEWATQTFPFGARDFRVLPSRDGQKSYIVATSMTQVGQVYAVEATGFRALTWSSRQYNSHVSALRICTLVPLAMLVLGCLLGLGTWFLMWRYTKPDYGFGIQNVKLASLGRRGLARLIDMALIGLTTIGLGAFLTRGLDWLALVEALHLYVVPPAVRFAAFVGFGLAIWLVACVITLVIVQGRTGFTPGKWLCGLRTLQTSLRPCGFARSLARELVFCVDALIFLWWAPGILAIALTDCRQRLGDLVADTLVVEAGSLK